MIDVAVEWEGGVELNTKIGDNSGERNELTIDGGTNVGSLGKLVGGANQDCLRPAAVELEVIVAHPGADDFQAGFLGWRQYGFRFDVDLGVVGIAVKIDVVLSDDMTKWPLWPLWDTTCHCCVIGHRTPQWHMIAPVGEVWGEPLQGCARHHGIGLEAVE